MGRLTEVPYSMEDLHYLLTFNHCNKKRCAVLFGELNDNNKYQVHQKIEKTMLEAPDSIKELMELDKSQEKKREIEPENEKYVYKILEHLDPTVGFLPG